MARTEPKTVKQHAIARIRDARVWSFYAITDLRRNDRVDALDSLAIAARAIQEAQTAIQGTLP